MLQVLLIVATNDPAETALKTLKVNITRFHNEENLQHSLVTVVEERELATLHGSFVEKFLTKNQPFNKSIRY